MALVIAAIVVQAVSSAGFCAYLASRKGKNGTAWFFLGLLFGLLALLTLVGTPAEGRAETAVDTQRRGAPGSGLPTRKADTADGRRIQLLRDEKVLFDKGPAILTDQRLVVEALGADGPVETPLGDLASFRQVNGGQESRARQGSQAIGVGVALLVIGTLARGASELIEAVLFVIGALALLFGIYFVLSSAIRVKPHTVVMFQTIVSGDVIVSFPGWDSPDAEELTRVFVRAKRAF